MKLEEDECICPQCNGEDLPDSVCEKCWGAGKLDWIELCMGKRISTETFILPKVRQAYPLLIAKQLVSVQPMKGPYAKTKT